MRAPGQLLSWCTNMCSRTVPRSGDGLKRRPGCRGSAAPGPLAWLVGMRLPCRIAAGFACIALGVAGCGAEPQAPAPQKRVELAISAPLDAVTVRGSSIEVSGRVSPPDAYVRVGGRPADVRGGTFTSVVGLEQGPNVIDVAATASGRATALTAFRVMREPRVAVPALAGVSADDAERAVQRLGLQLESERGGGLLDPLIPGPLAVCEQSPREGSEVRRGTTVRVIVARSC